MALQGVFIKKSIFDVKASAAKQMLKYNPEVA